jgi:hypothetical protein
MNTRFGTLCVVSVLAACGGGDSGPSYTPGTVNTAVAGTTATSATGIRTAAQSTDGNSMAGATFGLHGAASSMVSPAAPRLAQIDDVMAAMSAGFKAAADPANAAGDCICNANGCTFDQCGFGGDFLIDGTITISGDNYTFDMSLSGNYQGAVWSYDYTGALTISATLIDGTFTVDGNGTFSGGGQTITYSQDVSVIFDNVTLDSSGCAVGGSVTANISISVEGYEEGNYAVTGTATFGPACGQVSAS